MEDDLKDKIAAAIREQNGRRRESEKAAAFLREKGATYVRGVYHKRSGWWSAENVFLGARSIEARAEFERLNKCEMLREELRDGG
ncbi:MAG: hypothetical protein PHS86_00810 [Syntrophaceae bacterium]|nr:hypothetical protein [Syntrophaceae bacterium]